MRINDEQVAGLRELYGSSPYVRDVCDDLLEARKLLRSLRTMTFYCPLCNREKCGPDCELKKAIE